MKKIPLHCVCFVFGENSRARSEFMGRFPASDRISPDGIYRELCGDQYRNTIEQIVDDEIAHRIATALRLGKRVVVDGEMLDRRSRTQLLQSVMALGAPVYAIVCDETETVTYRGAEIIDVRATEVDFVEPLPVVGAAEYLSERYRGITAVGDVHGMHDSLLAAIAWTKSRGHYLILSGDLLDYGPNSIEVVDEVYRLVSQGDATLITGNHERKIARWLDGYRVRLSDGNRITTTGLMGLSDASRTKWAGRFRGLYQNSRLVQRIANTTFAHAAVHPSYWRTGKLDQKVENFAFFGEIDEVKSKSDRPVPSYRWADFVPANTYAVVGHNIRSRQFPIVQSNQQGGHALFLDTGSGKGGLLSSADFRFTDNGLKLESFHIY